MPKLNKGINNAMLHGNFLGLILLLLTTIVVAGCEGSAEKSKTDKAEQSTSSLSKIKGQTMKLTSTAFEADRLIPEKFTGVGADVSPALAWADAPEGTKSFALICDDPDAPNRDNPRPEGPWVHWVIYNIPPEVTELSEAIPRKAQPGQPAGALQGENDFGDDNVGYRGPMPPPGSGPHRYFFNIYALDTLLDLPADNADKKSLLAAMQGHILGEGRLMGTFERK